MEKQLQHDLYQKLKELIQNHVAPNLRFKKQENGKTVFLLVKNGNVPHLDKVPVYLKTLDVEEYPKERIKHNHGGTEGTILISLSKTKEASIKKIEEAYHLMKELKRNRNKPAKNASAVEQTQEAVVPKEQFRFREEILALIAKQEADKKVPPVTKPQRKKRDVSYGLRRYISSVLKGEGFSLKKDVKIQPLDCYCNFYTSNKDVSNLILHASNWYCHNTKAVTTVKEGVTLCVVVDLEAKTPAPKEWEKFNFCPPPKKGEPIDKVYARIVQILHSNKGVVLDRENSGVYKLFFRNKKNLFLQMAMREMHWNIKPSATDSFVTQIYTEEDMMVSNPEKKKEVKEEEVVAPGKPKEDLVVEKEINREMRRLFKDKEDAFTQLESFIGSQEFKTLASELQIELRDLWRNLWIKRVKEDPEKFANLLLNYLKD